MCKTGQSYDNIKKKLFKEPLGLKIKGCNSGYSLRNADFTSLENWSVNHTTDRTKGHSLKKTKEAHLLSTETNTDLRVEPSAKSSSVVFFYSVSEQSAATFHKDRHDATLVRCRPIVGQILKKKT